ncbi:MAG: M23 family metallopeptidase [Spirulinaceae cyanobacterium SM2_1_0]|nr:M23 family metallopeptidase [Spirulinaceae cyanobacterium SM2_1_0]
MESGVPLPQGFANPYRQSPSQRPIYPNNGNRGLLFPLALPARLTSAFGWRQHPIFGSWRMHAGTDLGAPQGTPVLAAYRGQVAIAEYTGGYGLMVVLRHLDGTQESRYAHLSQLFVQPGDWVEQGELVGLVGSTGNSTGPHLHFEWRHQLASGWVPVDAGPYLESALANLVRSIELAEAGFDPQDFYATPPDETAAAPHELTLGHAMLGLGTFFLSEQQLLAAQGAPAGEAAAQGAPPVGAAAARQPGQPIEVVPDPALLSPTLERRPVSSGAATDSRAPQETAG